MADYIEVDISALDQDVRDLTETLEKVRKDMNDMFDTMKKLDTMWEGPAHEAFMAQFDGDRQVFEELCNTVEGIIGSMEDAKNAYRKCEENVSSEIDKINI